MAINNENSTLSLTEGQEVFVKGKIEIRSHFDHDEWLIKLEDGNYTRIPEEEIYINPQNANDHTASVLQNNEDLTLDEKMKIMYTITGTKAKLNEGNECWVRATYVGKSCIHDESTVKIETHGLVERTSYLDVKDKDICFTKPNRMRKFKKRDKVKLVEPAPEAKFFIDYEIEYQSYIINYGISTNYEFVARLDKDYFTLEEARALCERLNRKEQDND